MVPPDCSKEQQSKMISFYKNEVKKTASQLINELCADLDPTYRKPFYSRLSSASPLSKTPTRVCRLREVSVTRKRRLNNAFRMQDNSPVPVSKFVPRVQSKLLPAQPFSLTTSTGINLMTRRASAPDDDFS